MGKINYLKYKKKQNNFKFIVLSISVITLSLSIGYSLFFESLTINGSATLAEVITNKLEVQLIQTGGRYVTGSFPANATYTNEQFDLSNNLTINLRRSNTTGKGEASVYYVDFRNSYGDNLTLGAVQTTNATGRINSSSSSLNKTALIPNETARLTVNLNHSNNGGAVAVNNVVRYTYKGVVKYFYFTINIV